MLATTTTVLLLATTLIQVQAGPITKPQSPKRSAAVISLPPRAHTAGKVFNPEHFRRERARVAAKFTGPHFVLAKSAGNAKRDVKARKPFDVGKRGDGEESLTDVFDQVDTSECRPIQRLGHMLIVRV